MSTDRPPGCQCDEIGTMDGGERTAIVAHVAPCPWARRVCRNTLRDALRNSRG